MDIIIFGVVFFVIVLPSVLVIKLCQYGLDLKRGCLVALKFPKEIISSHIRIFKILRRKNTKLAIRALIAPVFEFPEVLEIYATTYVNAYAKLDAIGELIPELKNKKDVEKLKLIAKKDGIIIKTKRNRVKEVLPRDPSKQYTLDSQKTLDIIFKQGIMNSSLC